MANPKKGESPAVDELLTGDDYERVIASAVSNWEEEQVGFPPYWNPKEVGRKFIARVIMQDDRDPNFLRYVLQATRVAVPCQKGPAEGAENVIAKPGEFFTCSQYAGLPLDRFFDIEVMVEVKASRKLPGNEESNGRPRDLWEFKVMVSPDDKKKLAARRADEHKLLAESRVKQASQLAS